MSERPTPETDNALSDCLWSGGRNASVYDLARKLERERDQAMQWKKEMLLVESEWNEQEVGKILGIQPGESIRANIEPKLRQLIRERDEARERLDEEWGELELWREGRIVAAKTREKILRLEEALYELEQEQKNDTQAELGAWKLLEKARAEIEELKKMLADKMLKVPRHESE